MFLGLVLVLAAAAGFGIECSGGTGCQPAWLGDGLCDNACNDAAHDYDGGDCIATATQSEYCANGCRYTWIGDGMCDSSCYNSAYNWDGGDCGS